MKDRVYAQVKAPTRCHFPNRGALSYGQMLCATRERHDMTSAPSQVNLAGLAASLAFSAHMNQLDKIGVAYIEHPRAVVEILMADGVTDERTIIVAWLHDVVEDTDVTLEHIERVFGEEIAKDIDAITHRKNEPRVDYYERVKARPHARRVKRADIAHNMDPERLSQLPREERKQKIIKYTKALEAIA